MIFILLIIKYINPEGSTRSESGHIPYVSGRVHPFPIQIPSADFATAFSCFCTRPWISDKADISVGTWQIHDHIHIIDESMNYDQSLKFFLEL